METKATKKPRARITLSARAASIKDLADRIQADFATARRRHRKMALDPERANALLTHVLTVIIKTGADPFGIPALASEASLIGKACRIEP